MLTKTKKQFPLYFVMVNLTYMYALLML